MRNFKLSIDLIPKGAWGNNFSKLLPKKEWDVLREACYKKANHRCTICGASDIDLDAHEVWDFDIKTKTQTLKNIVALCSACHGVKHMRNSERIGYGESAKRHFMKINRCSEIVFAGHYAEAQMMFDKRNEVLRWKIDADLSKFGANVIEFQDRNIPLIISPYEKINWQTVECVRKLTNDFVTVDLVNDGSQSNAKYFTSKPFDYIGPPKIRSIEADNYQGTITIVCNDTNKIEWLMDDEPIKTKYNVVGEFTTNFNVKDQYGSLLQFILSGDGGKTISESFKLEKAM